MKILVLTGSPHKEGTSTYLANQFVKGAEEAGHEVVVFDAGHKKIHPCIGCDQCHKSDHTRCVFEDDMKELTPLLLMADAVVFSGPIYYFGMNAQLKAAIDRFYANDELLKGDKKCAYLITCADTTDTSAAGAVTSYKAMASYLEWEDAGVLTALGCLDVPALQKTDYPLRAYQLGADF